MSAEPKTKPVPPELEARIRRTAKLRAEMLEDSALVAEGLRLVNRPGNDAKAKFIAAFVESERFDSYPLIASDMAIEAEVRWSQDFDPEIFTMRTVVAAEVDAAFRTVNAEPPVIVSRIAQTILQSDAGLKYGTLADVPVHDITVELVLAHLESLGYGWPNRIKMGVARRVMVVLLNRHRFEREPWPLDEAADAWEKGPREEQA